MSVTLVWNMFSSIAQTKEYFQSLIGKCATQAFCTHESSTLISEKVFDAMEIKPKDSLLSFLTYIRMGLNIQAWSPLPC